MPSVRPRRLGAVVELARRLDTRVGRTWRPDARRIVVNVRTPMNLATLAPIIARMQEDARIAFCLTASEGASAAPAAAPGPLPHLRRITPRAALMQRFDAYLAADFVWLPLPRGTRRVQTFHGVAGKYRTVYDGPSRPMPEWDRFFFINEHRWRRFVESGAIPADSPAARLVGMPRVDCLVDGSLDRDAVLRDLGVDPSRTTVLYAPTWTAHSSVAVMGEELVRRLAAAGHAVIVKLHDRSRDPRAANSGGVDWGARLEPLARASGGMLATGADASPYLAACDVLVTDHSSVAFEYLLLDRPVVRIEMPELIARADIEPTYVELLASASTSVRTAAEAVAVVERACAAPMEHSASRRGVAREMFYRPGTATDRAVRNLYELIELPPPTPDP